MPGADRRLATLLGLGPSVRTTMLYVNGCSSASTALRVAKDVAENNRGARVLVACAELTLVMFRAPDDVGTVVTQALLGDGSGALIVGADADAERPIFDMVAASQSVIPGTEHAAAGGFGEDGFRFYPSVEMPALVRDNVEGCLVDALGPLGFRPMSGGSSTSWAWNELFWAVHPGGRAILDNVEEALRLDPGKLAASRHVLSEYGNMSGPTLIFVLDEIRRRRDEHHGLGVMLGIGPGVTVETMVLHATGNNRTNV